MGKRIFLPPHSMSRNVTNSGGIINGRVGVHHCIVNTLTIFWSIGTNWENWLTMLVCQKAMVASLRAWEEMLVHNLILLIHVQVKLQFWICPPVCWTFRIQCDGPLLKMALLHIAYRLMSLSGSQYCVGEGFNYSVCW